MSEMSAQRKRTASRAGLLASTAVTGVLIAAIGGHPQRALAACLGENSANVTCDAAHPASLGALTTTFAGTTLVNINAGAAITAGAQVNVIAPGSLTFNHNDPAGITGFAGNAVSLSNGNGGITYVGNADVTGSGSSGIGAAGGGAGNVLVTNNATVFGTLNGVTLSHTGTGAIRFDGTGSARAFNGSAISIAHTGIGPAAGTNGIVVSGSGGTDGAATGIVATITSAANASNILVDRAGTIGGGVGIIATSAGTGNVTVAGNNTITATAGNGIIALQSGNAAGTVGSVTVGGSGDITASSNGIDATIVGGNNSGNVTVTRNGVITANGVAINALNSGTGNVSVTGAGNVISATSTGIGAAAAAGNVTVARTGAVVSTGIGIFTSTAGSGTSNVIVSNDVVSSGNDGVRTSTANGTNTITVNGGIVRGLTNGISAASGAPTTVTVAAGATVDSLTGAGVFLSSSSTNMVLNDGTIVGTTGILTMGGSTTVVNSGSIAGTGTGVRLQGANNLFVMSGPAASLSGPAIGSGTDTFRLAGAGSNSFDLFQLGSGWTLFDKAGTSTWTVTGFGTHTGAVTVSEGTLLVNGSFAFASGVSVGSGATLGGNGVLPDTIVNAGGTLAPGNNAVGTMFVNRSLTFSGATTYAVDVSPTQADFTNVSGGPGTATLSGTLRANGTGGAYTVGTRYTVMAATGGLSGTFGNLAISGNFGFTRPHIEYDANNVYLVLDLASVASALNGGTPNQRAVAGAVDAAFLAGNGPAPFVALVGLTSPQLNQALDQLSGEVHASTAGVLASDSLFMRSAILGRLRQASYASSDTAAMAALSLGGPQMAFADADVNAALAYAKSPAFTKAPIQPNSKSDLVFWAQGVGGWGRFGSDGNAAAVRSNLAGFIAGVDTSVASNGRAGIAAGYSGAKNALDGRGASNIDTAHVAAYGGWRSGAVNLRGGGAYAHHTIATDRSIAFPGFFDRTLANYNGHTGQVFGEVGYGFALGKIALEPFAGAAWVRVDTGSATERGGLAALNLAATSFDTRYSALGVRAASIVPLGGDMLLIPRATLAWQHAFGSVTPNATLAFQAAPVPFTIAGVPIARDALLAEAGLDLAIGRNVTVGVSYLGQLSDNVQSHAAKGKFNWAF